MTRARTRLLLEQPWFGSLAMRLEILADDTIPTLATNGSVLKYNPSFVDKQTGAHMLGIMAHEVLHCALLHPYRRGSRDPLRWNIACDYAINPLILGAGMFLPDNVLLDAQYNGLSADVIYAKLTDVTPEMAERSHGTGTVEDGPKEPQASPEGIQQGMTADDWAIAGNQATAVTKASGNTPGDVARAAKRAHDKTEDWRTVLHEFVEHQQPSDYSWSSPNRRHIAGGLYLPGIVKENLGRLGIGVDTSGSISQAVLDCFASEVTGIMHEARPSAVEVVYCDHEIQHTEEFTPDDAEIKLAMHGGGGTRFQPVFDHFNGADDPPAALLYFTDLENGHEKLTEPDYPVLFVTGKDCTEIPPFGRVIRIDLYD